MRLIDADALIKAIVRKEPFNDCARVVIAECMEEVRHAPTIEPERKKGEWIHGRELSREMIGDCVTAIFYDGWKCSECDCLVEEEREPLYKYCPYCGAKMEGR